MNHLAVHLLCKTLLLLGVPVPPEPGEAVAEVLGKTIHARALEPQAHLLRAQNERLTPEEFADWLHQHRLQMLRAYIWSALVEDYVLKHDLLPTDEEVESIIVAFASGHDPQEDIERAERTLARRRAELAVAEDDQREWLEWIIQTDEQELERMRARTPEQSAQHWRQELDLQRPVFYGWVLHWKFDRDIFRIYGGEVIYQQIGREPIDAHRQWLRDQERDGHFEIHDDELRRQFWEYIENRRGVAIREDDPFASPWWEALHQD